MEGFDALDEGVKICYVVETIHVLTEDSRARVGLYALLCQVAVPHVRYCKGQRGGREGVRAGNRQVMAPDRDCTCAAMGTNYSKAGPGECPGNKVVETPCVDAKRVVPADSSPQTALRGSSTSYDVRCCQV